MWRKYLNICTSLLCVLQAQGFRGYVSIIDDGPTVQGGSITFQADIYNYDGSRPSGDFRYTWKDNGVPGHQYQTPSTKNTTSIWRVDYPAEFYPVGEYSVEVLVSQYRFLFWTDESSQHKRFEITALLNGNISISQSNHTLESSYISSEIESEIKIDMRQGDADYIIKNSTELSTFWFVDCKYYGQTNDFTFKYNFSRPDETRSIEALVVASHEPLTTTTMTPTTTSTTPAPASNITTAKPITTTTLKPVTTMKPSVQNNSSSGTIEPGTNITFPYVCVNTSMVPPDPKKTYGYFHRNVYVRAPIKNITVEGTNWIKPWEMLNLSVSCHGSGPFLRCLEFHRGTYNVTGNETCINGTPLNTCNFSIIHFFLEANVYTILVMLKNNVSTTVYPLTINIYEVTAKPQLSVIVVPVSCSLAAVVLVVFGIAYYIQSRARFTVEVADFDFGHNNPDMEYKTFGERLRDSLNSTVSDARGIHTRPSYYGSMNRCNINFTGYKPLTDPTAPQT